MGQRPEASDGADTAPATGTTANSCAGAGLGEPGWPHSRATYRELSPGPSLQEAKWGRGWQGLTQHPGVSVPRQVSKASGQVTNEKPPEVQAGLPGAHFWFRWSLRLLQVPLVRGKKKHLSRSRNKAGLRGGVRWPQLGSCLLATCIPPRAPGVAGEVPFKRPVRQGGF